MEEEIKKEAEVAQAGIEENVLPVIPGTESLAENSETVGEALDIF